MKIFDYTESREDREQYIEWDVLLSPHHCSKKVMYVSGAAGDEYQTDVMSAFDRHGRNTRTVVSSSLPTPAADTAGANPPHRKARSRYEEIADTFVCTMEWPTAEAPAPVVFALDANGLAMVDPQDTANLASQSSSEAKALGRLAAVVAAAGIVAAGIAGRQGGARAGSEAVDRRSGTEAVRRAIVTDRGGHRAPAQPTGFGR